MGLIYALFLFQVLEDIRQRYLETVLPKEAGEVIIVAGEHKGERGKVCLPKYIVDRCGVAQ